MTTNPSFEERRIICQKKIKKRVEPAWRLLSEICANLIEYLKKILHSQDFVDRHKTAEKDFTRKRHLSFQTLFLYFINFIKGSYQHELEHFFKTLYSLEAERATCIRRQNGFVSRAKQT